MASAGPFRSLPQEAICTANFYEFSINKLTFKGKIIPQRRLFIGDIARVLTWQSEKNTGSCSTMREAWPDKNLPQTA
jgi:hypothetical protein